MKKPPGVEFERIRRVGYNGSGFGVVTAIKAKSWGHVEISRMTFKDITPQGLVPFAVRDNNICSPLSVLRRYFLRKLAAPCRSKGDLGGKLLLRGFGDILPCYWGLLTCCYGNEPLHWQSGLLCTYIHVSPALPSTPSNLKLLYVLYCIILYCICTYNTVYLLLALLGLPVSNPM